MKRFFPAVFTLIFLSACTTTQTGPGSYQTKLSHRDKAYIQSLIGGRSDVQRFDMGSFFEGYAASQAAKRARLENRILEMQIEDMESERAKNTLSQ